MKELERWRALATKELGGTDAEELTRVTPDGLPIRPLYTAADHEGLAFADTLRPT